ncbi:hypothetical protein H0H93_014035, partial [Arthromyces matolae]
MGEFCQDATECINDTLYSVVTDDFLNKMCPVDPVVSDNIFRILKTRGLYDTNEGCWAKLQEIENKAGIYAPFAEIANAIVGALPNEIATRSIFYILPPNKPPKVLNSTMEARRPD